MSTPVVLITGAGSIINICSTYWHEGAVPIDENAFRIRAAQSHRFRHLRDDVSSRLDLAIVAHPTGDAAYRVTSLSEATTRLPSSACIGCTPPARSMTARRRCPIDTIVFIASDKASFITGHVLHVDGGKTAG
jgi:NAD(P)-dependent dehydrogenase (short-subunit alcohol dehydrogenase family)